MRNPWTAEAKANHRTGVERYQRQLAGEKLFAELYPHLETFARRKKLNLERVIDAFGKTVMRFQGRKRLKPEIVESYFHGLLQSR